MWQVQNSTSTAARVTPKAVFHRGAKETPAERSAQAFSCSPFPRFLWALRLRDMQLPGVQRGQASPPES